MKKVIWMKVTSDELELPVAIADSAEELARITGAKANSIRNLACRRGKGKKNSPYIRMEIDEEEEK